MTNWVDTNNNDNDYRDNMVEITNYKKEKK
jgi:hypothetical protein